MIEKLRAATVANAQVKFERPKSREGNHER